MKISFVKLPETPGTIEVSYNSGNSYVPYNTEDIRNSGITLDDNQDYSQIQIKGKASILKNLDIVKSISIENSSIYKIVTPCISSQFNIILSNLPIIASKEYTISLMVDYGSSFFISEKAIASYYYENIRQGFRLMSEHINIFNAEGGVIDSITNNIYGQAKGAKVLIEDELKNFIPELFEYNRIKDEEVSLLAISITDESGIDIVANGMGSLQK